jgi:hypothetical protein
MHAIDWTCDDVYGIAHELASAVTYRYSTDLILDTTFGPRPERYREIPVAWRGSVALCDIRNFCDAGATIPTHVVWIEHTRSGDIEYHAYLIRVCPGENSASVAYRVEGEAI